MKFRIPVYTACYISFQIQGGVLCVATSIKIDSYRELTTNYNLQIAVLNRLTVAKLRLATSLFYSKTQQLVEL